MAQTETSLQDEMFGNVGYLTRSKWFKNLLPYTGAFTKILLSYTYTSHMLSCLTIVVTHAVCKWCSVCFKKK